MLGMRKGRVTYYVTLGDVLKSLCDILGHDKSIGKFIKSRFCFCLARCWDNRYTRSGFGKVGTLSCNNGPLVIVKTWSSESRKRREDRRENKCGLHFGGSVEKNVCK